MKKLLLIGLLGLSSFSHADYCMDIKEFSFVLMDARQRGVSEQRAHDILIENKQGLYEDFRVLDSLVDWAYTLPVKTYDFEKKVSVYDFSKKAYETCVDFFGEE